VRLSLAPCCGDAAFLSFPERPFPAWRPLDRPGTPSFIIDSRDQQYRIFFAFDQFCLLSDILPVCCLSSALVPILEGYEIWVRDGNSSYFSWRPWSVYFFYNRQVFPSCASAIHSYYAAVPDPSLLPPSRQPVNNLSPIFRIKRFNSAQLYAVWWKNLRYSYGFLSP